jgi:hypothetical protein
MRKFRVAVLFCAHRVEVPPGRSVRACTRAQIHGKCLGDRMAPSSGRPAVRTTGDEAVIRRDESARARCADKRGRTATAGNRRSFPGAAVRTRRGRGSSRDEGT